MSAEADVGNQLQSQLQDYVLEQTRGTNSLPSNGGVKSPPTRHQVDELLLEQEKTNPLRVRIDARGNPMRPSRRSLLEKREKVPVARIIVSSSPEPPAKGKAFGRGSR